MPPFFTGFPPVLRRFSGRSCKKPREIRAVYLLNNVQGCQNTRKHNSETPHDPLKTILGCAKNAQKSRFLGIFGRKTGEFRNAISRNPLSMAPKFFLEVCPTENYFQKLTTQKMVFRVLATRQMVLMSFYGVAVDTILIR